MHGDCLRWDGARSAEKTIKREAAATAPALPLFADPSLRKTIDDIYMPLIDHFLIDETSDHLYIFDRRADEATHGGKSQGNKNAIDAGIESSATFFWRGPRLVLAPIDPERNFSF